MGYIMFSESTHLYITITCDNYHCYFCLLPVYVIHSVIFVLIKKKLIIKYLNQNVSTRVQLTNYFLSMLSDFWKLIEVVTSLI